MTTLREAAQQALDALNTYRIMAVSETETREVTPKKVTGAIDALRAALQVDDTNVVDIGKPLPDEEIEKLRHLIDWTADWSYLKFARAIEAAHGIKDET